MNTKDDMNDKQKKKAHAHAQYRNGQSGMLMLPNFQSPPAAAEVDEPNYKLPPRNAGADLSHGIINPTIPDKPRIESEPDMYLPFEDYGAVISQHLAAFFRDNEEAFKKFDEQNKNQVKQPCRGPTGQPQPQQPQLKKTSHLNFYNRGKFVDDEYNKSRQVIRGRGGYSRGTFTRGRGAFNRGTFTRGIDISK